MATERTQRHSSKGRRGGADGAGADSTGNEELRGVTEEGVEVSASLDDDEQSGTQGTRGSSGQRGGGGNFANDRERASEAGRKGGRH